jgi:alpha-beta hydrolase superfamily lysophospholipase
MSARAEEFEVGHIPVYRYTSKTAAPDYALILLPGIGGYGGYYPDFCAMHVEKGLEIWAMDPPGHGRSKLPRGQFTMEAYIEDVLTLAEHIARTTGLPVFTLGSSLGSGTAFLALEQSPHLVSGIGMGVAIPAAGWMADARAALASKGVAQLLEVFGNAIQFNIFRFLNLEKNYGDPERVKKVYNDPNVCWHYDLASWRSYLTYDPQVPTEQNSKPHLVIVGGADPLFPTDDVKRVFARLGGPVTLDIVEGAPHQVMFDRPDYFSTKTDTWVRSHLVTANAAVAT